MKDFIEFLKLPPTIMAAISISSGCVLFLPETVLFRMGLQDLKSPYNMIVAIVFLLSTALFIIYFLTNMYNRIKDNRFNKKFPKIFNKVMSELTDEERALIYYLNSQGDKTASLPMGSGIIMRLTAKMIIQLTTNIALTGPELAMPYTLTEATIKYLREHPNYLDDIADEVQEEIDAHEKTYWQY